MAISNPPCQVQHGLGQLRSSLNRRARAEALAQAFHDKARRARLNAKDQAESQSVTRADIYEVPAPILEGPLPPQIGEGRHVESYGQRATESEFKEAKGRLVIRDDIFSDDWKP